MNTTRPTRTEWGVRHSQGIATGGAVPYDERYARARAAEMAAADSNRRPEARGKVHVVRREVTEWEDA